MWVGVGGCGWVCVCVFPMGPARTHATENPLTLLFPLGDLHPPDTRLPLRTFTHTTHTHIHTHTHKPQKVGANLDIVLVTNVSQYTPDELRGVLSWAASRGVWTYLEGLDANAADVFAATESAAVAETYGIGCAGVACVCGCACV